MDGIGGRAQRGSFMITATAAVLALTVNTAFGVLVLGGSTKGQRLYDTWDKEARTVLASAAGPLHKACNKG